MWDQEPDADMLLAARLERGWTPTATALSDGTSAILGYAACTLRPGKPSS